MSPLADGGFDDTDPNQIVTAYTQGKLTYVGHLKA